MWLILLLMLLMPLLAWSIVRAVWLFRLRHIDADNEMQSLPEEKHFMQISTIVLSLLLLMCIPLLYQGYVQSRLNYQLMQMPLVDVMRAHRPHIYDSFVQDVRHAQARDSDSATQHNKIWMQYLHELRLQWQRELPYASLDSVMRYIRYRYNEADTLGEIADDHCRHIDFSEHNQAGIAASVNFMQRNAGFIQALMLSAFGSVDARHRMNYLEQRGAARQYRQLLTQLNQQFEGEVISSIAEGGCGFQKAFYLALLDYNEREMSRIMRWVLLQQIAEADRKELSDGK